MDGGAIEKNKEVIRRFVEEVQGKHHLDLVEDLMDPNMVDHYFEMQGLPPSDLNATDGFKKFFSGMLVVFPDLNVVHYNMIAEGDMVATHKTFRATHKGEFMGVPPTGKQVEVEVIDIFRIAGGKMVEHWGLVNWMSVLKQLGVGAPTKPQA